MYTVLIFHDGRNDYLAETLKSFSKQVKFPKKTYKILHIDNPKESIADYEDIKKEFKIDEVVITDKQLGIFKSVQNAWSLIPKNTEYIFHLENDFTFNEKINIEELQKPLDANKHIYQVALLRQAWYPNEIKKGGIYKANNGYRAINAAGIDLIAHRNYFTHNPCLYRANITAQLRQYDEYSFMRYLIQKDKQGMSTYLGKINDKPKVTHIGEFKRDGSKSA